MTAPLQRGCSMRRNPVLLMALATHYSRFVYAALAED